MARTTRELTDAQWVRLAPLLPPQRPRMGRPPKDHRLIVEAIVWLDRTGAPWRDLPAEYGPWETVASRFYRWRRRGVWERVLACLQADADARGELDWLLHVVDGSVVRAHQHAAGARRRPAKAAYHERNRVEHTINWLKGWRRVATRYEKRDVNHLAMVTIAAIVLLWLR